MPCVKAFGRFVSVYRSIPLSKENDAKAKTKGSNCRKRSHSEITFGVPGKIEGGPRNSCG